MVCKTRHQDRHQALKVNVKLDVRIPRFLSARMYGSVTIAIIDRSVLPESSVSYSLDSDKSEGRIILNGSAAGMTFRDITAHFSVDV